MSKKGTIPLRNPLIRKSFATSDSGGGNGGGATYPVTLAMNDSFGDGWNGGIITITDASGSEVYSGTLENGDTKYVPLDLSDQEYSVILTGGSYPGERSWQIVLESDGTLLATGGSDEQVSFTPPEEYTPPAPEPLTVSNRNLVAVDIKGTRFTVGFTPAQSQTGLDVTHVAYLSTSPNLDGNIQQIIDNAEFTSDLLVGFGGIGLDDVLSLGTKYWFNVIASDTAGNQLKYTMNSATTLPNDVTAPSINYSGTYLRILTFSGGGLFIRLAAPSDNVTSFSNLKLKVYTSLGSSPLGTLSEVDQNGKLYKTFSNLPLAPISDREIDEAAYSYNKYTNLYSTNPVSFDNLTVVVEDEAGNRSKYLDDQIYDSNNGITGIYNSGFSLNWSQTSADPPYRVVASNRENNTQVFNSLTSNKSITVSGLMAHTLYYYAVFEEDTQNTIITDNIATRI